MNEEEIISKLKLWIQYACINNGKSCIVNNKELQGLLDLYNKEKEKNKELIIKINRIKEIIDTSPYTAYTAYGNILYDDQAIRDIIEDTNKFEGDIW